ncbi:hypothetical protein DYB32_008632 [Aphanomyces invadans]|uniref:Uncharacterized protein n=1 Tax=Aphanomyces invadans TaxID=157072 RepID=A0A3R6YYX2_9STRA|nr:hypothetical protein DYB32_008632 [Aphanomyces invadans]
MAKKEEVKEAVAEAPVVVEVPKDPPGWELVWKVLTKDQVDMLVALSTPAAVITALCELLHVEHYADNPRSRAYVDFCFYNFMFAKDEAGFSAEKLALFFAIMAQVFDHATSAQEAVSDTDELRKDGDPTQMPKLPSLVDNYSLFKNLIKQHSVDMPGPASGVQPVDNRPEYVAIFSLDDVQRIVRYLTSTFYQHFKAYQWAFHVYPAFVRCVHSVMIETPLVPPPLTTALELQCTDPLCTTASHVDVEPDVASPAVF